MPVRLLPRKIPGKGLSSLLGLLLFAAALFALQHALGEFHYHQVLQQLQSIPTARVYLGLVLTVFGYLVLTVYDHLAIAYVQHPLARGRVTLASFISYAFSNTIGFSILTGGSLRYRFYSAWGLSAKEVAQVLIFTISTFWLGILTLGGALFLALPPTLPLLGGASSPLLRAIGVFLLFGVALYLLAAFRVRRPVRVKEWEVPLPSLQLAILQILVGALDWALAGTILFVLLPPTAGLSLGGFLGIYLFVQIAALVSHVPGGLGVLEALMVLFVPQVPGPELLGCLLVFRGIYYLLPLGVATVLLGGMEVLERRAALQRIGSLAGRWASIVAPSVLAAATLVAGAMLLFSGATPAVPERLRWLRQIVPLPLLELSHFLGSLTGAVLLVLARGLQRRLESAFHVAVGLLLVGVFFSLLKGADYEEATVLILVLLTLLPAHRQFYRAASVWDERFTPGWVAAIAAVLLSSVWLGFFCYKHVEFSKDLWWTFTLHGNAPRFLRSAVGAAVLLLLFGLGRLLRPSRAAPSLPGPEELERANRIVQMASHTEGHLALLGDKALLFSANGTAFIMYGTEGRSWIAMGDPVGSATEGRDLAWNFHELAERHDGWTVFYEVGPENLPLYLDLGLTLLKIGETASIPLGRFSLEGGGQKNLRQGFRRLEREGLQFGISEVEAVPALIPELKRISDAWLQQKNAREKGFSLGFFQPEYLQRLPIAWVRKDGSMVAFANLWRGADRDELSIDLMRFVPDTTHGIMDFLLVSLLLWGKEEGFHHFNLGMAPLAGLEDRPHAPLWNRMGALLYRHGEHFYNFQGLRAYKEKFNPEWESRYLALPGGFILPKVLADIATLISGGVKGVFGK